MSLTKDDINIIQNMIDRSVEDFAELIYDLSNHFSKKFEDSDARIEDLNNIAKKHSIRIRNVENVSLVHAKKWQKLAAI